MTSAGQPSAIPSTSLTGSGSGWRRILNEMTSPARPASSGTRSAICRASGRASVLMWMISALHVRRLPGQHLGQLGVAQHLGVVLQGLRDLLLLGRREHAAVLGQVA